MKRRTKVIISLAVLICIGIWGLFFINKHHFIMWNANKVVVAVASPLKQEKVKIEFGVSVNTINRSSDTDLFKNRSKYTVIYDGEHENDIYNEYGENDFLITYDNRYYLSFRHFKLHSRSQHDYHFQFAKKKDVISVEVNIEGQDAMKFKMDMIPISQSKNKRCNTDIEEAGVVYDGVNLR